MKQHDMEKLDNIPVPKERLLRTRQEALYRIKKEQHKRKEWTYRFILSATAVLLLVGVVRFYAGDELNFGFLTQGEDDILVNDYVQLIDEYVTEEGVTLTVDSVIADAYGMRVMYSLEAPFDLSTYNISGAVLSQGGKELQAASSYGWGSEIEQTNHITEQLDFFVGEEGLSNARSFTIDLSLKGEKEIALHLPFTLPKAFHQQQQYVLNQTLVVEKQKFTVQEVILTPVRTMVKISSDEQNDEQILSFGNISLVDERNQEIASAQNGLTASGIMSEGKATYLFESAYINPPEQLTLHIENMNALPKDENYVEVNFAKRRADFVPKWLMATLTVSVDSVTFEDEGHIQTSYAIDANGQRFEMESHSSSGNESTTTYPVIEMEDPVKIYFYDYPRTIEFEREISVF